MRGSLLLLSSLLLVSCGMPAQEHAMHSPEGQATLSTGLGNHHHPISTKNAQAQQFFDQGLTLVYGFNHDEAVRSFKRAAELDPLAPMPWWGIALAVGPNYNQDVDMEHEKAAQEAIRKARTLAANAPQNERDYVDTLARRYTDDPKPDFKKLAVDYKNAMRDLSKKYPDDLDAATIYAESMMDLNPWNLWTSDGKPAENTEEIVAVLQSVLKRDPQHVGANHYFIHAVEASPHPEQALVSAQRLETLVPAAGHLVHMPAHIYQRTGNFEGAAKANEAGAKADRDFLAAAKAEGGMYDLMYYSHNLHFLAMSAGMEGKSSEAMEAASKLAAHVTPGIKQMPMLEWFLPMRMFMMARFEKWSEILALAEPEPSLAITRAFWHYARGAAFAAMKDIDKANRERAELAAGMAKVPQDAMFGYNMAHNVMGVAVEALDARIAEAQGNRKDAIDLWRKAVAGEDALSYDEPADWYYPCRESLGGTLLRDGQFAEAETVFRVDLEKNPRNPRSLFGLALALESQNKPGVDSVRQQFKQAWKNADVPLRLEDL